MKALALDPNARFSSAEEMAHQLRRIAYREELVASTSEVGSWVKASLGPTLAARRAASLRGTGHTDPPPAVSPSVAPPALDDARIPSDAPSAREITGPIEPPASQAFGENTEVIRQLASQGQSSAPRRQGGGFQKVVTYCALGAGLGIVLWAVLSPVTFARFFKLEQATLVDDQGAAPPTTPSTPTPPASATVPTVSGDTQQVQIDESGKVVLPPIRPSGEQ